MYVQQAHVSSQLPRAACRACLCCGRHANASLLPVTPHRRRSALLQCLDLQFNGVWRRETPFKIAVETPHGDASWALCRLPMTDNAQKLNPSSLSDCRFPSVHFCVVVQGVAVMVFATKNLQLLTILYIIMISTLLFIMKHYCWGVVLCLLQKAYQ